LSVPCLTSLITGATAHAIVGNGILFQVIALTACSYTSFLLGNSSYN